MEHFGVATLCHISRSQEQRNMACDVLIFTINSSILPSVVSILGGKTGRGISGKINRLSEFEQRNVVGVRLRALIVLVHDRVDLQLHVLPGDDGENEA